jgi:hypothetical protein
MEINKTLFNKFAELRRMEKAALEAQDYGKHRETLEAILEITNDLEELGLEFEIIDNTLCLTVKPQRPASRILCRSYQYPNAVKTFVSGEDSGIKGAYAWWIVNEIGDTPLHGVIRYTMDSQRELESYGWFESDAFGDDAEAAEHWIRKKVAELQGKNAAS